ncbi:MAG TPA: hypothetical protein VGH88_00425 [Streptosporangiaceae bacterium]|jgi:hypothetical protein
MSARQAVACALEACESMQAAGRELSGATCCPAGREHASWIAAGPATGFARLRPVIASLGHYEVALSRYGSGPRGGGAVLVIPADRAGTRSAEHVLEAHGATAVSYLGKISAGQLGAA